jgi:hypothetical protein
MCGIVGAVLHYNGGFITQTEDCFYQMLYADALRGWDSTGVIAVEKDGSFHIAKEASEASFFWPTFKNSDVGKRMWNEGKVLIGHNRKKTLGAIKDETAHPFVVDDTFAMVHNGTLINHKKFADTDVDSEALAIVLKKALEQDNYREALETTLGEVLGAYAVAIYDQKKEKVHLLRNKERPLAIIKTDNATFFASEPMMALWILARNNYVMNKVVVEDVSPDTLYTYDLLKNEWKKEAFSPKKPTLKPTTSSTGSVSASSLSGVGNNRVRSVKMAKHLIKKLLGTKVSFWVDDFVEENCPKTLEEGETEVLLFASCDDIKWNHSITAKVDLSQFGFSTRENIEDHRWMGEIWDVLFNEKTESLIIDLVDCKPVLQSLPGKEMLQKMFFEQLQNKSISKLRAELQQFGGHLQEWQREMYNDTIGEKLKKYGDLEAAFFLAGKEAIMDEAKAEGVLLTEEVRDGKEFLIHPTKGIVYESPVAIH